MSAPCPAHGETCETWADIQTTTEPGAYGIMAVEPHTPGALVCGSCGRAWLEDITPAGRCPWEDQHEEPFDLVGSIIEGKDGKRALLSIMPHG